VTIVLKVVVSAFDIVILRRWNVTYLGISDQVASRAKPDPPRSAPTVLAAEPRRAQSKHRPPRTCDLALVRARSALACRPCPVTDESVRGASVRLAGDRSGLWSAMRCSVLCSICSRHGPSHHNRCTRKSPHRPIHRRPRGVELACANCRWVQIMPQVILTSKICPKGVEATMYAVLAGEYPPTNAHARLASLSLLFCAMGWIARVGFQNFGGMVATSIGAALIDILGIKTTVPCNFDKVRPRTHHECHNTLPHARSDLHTTALTHGAPCATHESPTQSLYAVGERTRGRCSLH
jgi:hypothetical protein